MSDKRLIDANALKDKLISNAGSIKGKRSFDKGESWGFELAAKIVSYFPEIDPETLRPVAHWEESACSDDAFWVCSNCKFPSEAIAAPRLYHYCPNCGAKMEE